MLDAIEKFKREATRTVGFGGAIESALPARVRCVRLGRPRKVMNEHRDDVLRLRAEGMSGRAIAKTLGTSSSNVFRLIATLEKAA
jgi:hypothetical protein